MNRSIPVKIPAVPGTRFLPVSRKDMEERGWEELDFLFVMGDAYVDHPSFGPAIISRVLEKGGFRVGMLPQPDWRSRDAFLSLGRPRLGVLVSAGNLDSMLSKLTASRKSRSTDSFSPGGRPGMRPDRATIAYCSRIRECWKDIPLVIGGVEASLRRFAHYDYWSDEVRRSVLVDSQADLLVFGMGEKQILEIASLLQEGVPVRRIRDVRGTVFRIGDIAEARGEFVEVPSFEEVRSGREAFAEAFRGEYLEQDPFRGKGILQRHGSTAIFQNPPASPLSQAEMDAIYDLPYTRTYHPMYESQGGVPAIAEVRFSLVSHRGCFGSCSFCAIHCHQGRIIQNRSHESLLREAEILASLPDFKGYIHDVGGPTANFRVPSCQKQLRQGTCRNRQCLVPTPCPKLSADHGDYIALLRKLRSVKGVKKVFIRSGVRYDYLLLDRKGGSFLEELCAHHVSGQLKVAPEHVSDKVLSLMGKCRKSDYEAFQREYAEMNRKLGRKQYLVPYFISSHPGAGLQEAVELAEFVRDLRFMPEQVQDFIPTPGSLSTCMYWTGLDPLTGSPVHVPREKEERAMQRALLQYGRPENRELVLRALKKAGRMDLVGTGPRCLVSPVSSGSPAGKRDVPGARKAPGAGRKPGRKEG